MVSPVSFADIALNDDFFSSNIPGPFNADKALVLNDIIGDGQKFGRSKVSERKLTINIIARRYDLARLMNMNATVQGNTIKPLVIDTDIGQLTGMAECTNFAWSDDTPLMISMQLTMPDPHWYSAATQSVQLGVTYSTGVVFGPGQGMVFGPRKNLLNPVVGSTTLNGITYTVASDGTITLDTGGKATTAGTNIYVAISPIGFISGKSYTLSDTNISGSKTGSWNAAITDSAKNGVVNLGSTVTGAGQSGMYLLLYVGSGCTLTNYEIRFQLEQGNTATVWTPYSNAGAGAVFGTATGGAATITNDGNVDAYPIITVVGTCSGISIANLTTGETAAVNVALAESDTLVIDCRPATCGVYLNDIANIGLKTSPGWIHCPPGDNQFSFSRSSLQNKKHCTIQLQSRWI